MRRPPTAPPDAGLIREKPVPSATSTRPKTGSISGTSTPVPGGHGDFSKVKNMTLLYFSNIIDIIDADSKLLKDDFKILPMGIHVAVVVSLFRENYALR